MIRTWEYHMGGIIATHGNTYQYSKTPSDQQIKGNTSIQITCNLHGNFKQTITSHKSGSGCPKCARINIRNKQKKGTKYFLSKAAKTHNNKYDYSLITDDKLLGDCMVNIICPIHGQFIQTLKNHTTFGCKQCATQNNVKSNDEHIRDFRAIHKDKYKYTQFNDKQVYIECDTHGQFIQLISNHKTGHGCPDCGKLSVQRSISKFKNKQGHDTRLLLHDSYWLLSQTNKFSLTQIAKNIECSSETVRQAAIQQNIPYKKYYYGGISQQELEIANFIKELGIEVIQSDRTTISPFELDIVLPQYNIAIEYCGLYWHSEQQGKNKHYHRKKYDMCKKAGIQLITIFEDEWVGRNKQVKNKIRHLTNNSNQNKVGARNCDVVLLSSSQKKQFFDVNHIQGNGPGSISIGLSYNNDIVAAITLIKQGNLHYLNRFATSCIVSGAFGKLVKYFCKNYNWHQIISFADLRWSNGQLYDNNGWILKDTIPPDYKYSPPNSGIRTHKFNYRHKNLGKLLETYCPDLSERQNCDNNGILRIWDCGKHKYVINELEDNYHENN